MNGKNEPLLRDMFKEKFNKSAMTKDGKQSKAYMDWKRKDFKPMKNTVLKNFGNCIPDIENGNKTPTECYETARDSAVEKGSIYISPAYRSKNREAKLQAQYDLIKLEADYNKKHGIK